MGNQRLEETIKKDFCDQPDENYRVLTFGELNVGDKYICLPMPGDNSGHSGFKGRHYIFQKVEKQKVYPAETYPSGNAIRKRDGIISLFPDTMPVIKVE